MQIQLKVTNGNKVGQLITINRPRFLIGRAEDCQLQPKSDLISRYHCVIVSEEGYAAVRDLGSRNGVFVNGEQVTIEEELHQGDKLTIGPLEFEVILSVALSSTKKPRVESIEDVVTRTVQRDVPVAQGGEKKEDDSAELASWLMDDDEASEMVQDAITAALNSAEESAEKTDSKVAEQKADNDHKDYDALLQAATVKPVVSQPKTSPSAAAKQSPLREAPQKAPPKEDSPSKPMKRPEEAANLLKNFFKNQ